MIKGINPGRLNKRLGIYAYKEYTTELNNTAVRLTRIRTVWAQMKPVRGTEFLEYYRDTNMLQYKIYMRYIPDLDEKCVLVHGDKQYEIQSIIDVEEAGLYFEVYCSEMKDKQILYDPKTVRK